MAADLIKAGASVMSGRAAARGLANEAALADTQAAGVDLQALQSSERRREDRRAMMASLEAQRAARGLSLDTPTATAITTELRRQSVRDEGAERVGFMNQSDAYRRSARAKRKGASSVMAASYLEAAGTMYGAVEDRVSTLFAPKKGGK